MTLSLKAISGMLGAAALFLAGPALADTEATSPAATEQAAVAAPTGPALWKVSDEDTTIYLFGTVHALPEGVEWFNGKIADALESSDTIVTEIEMDETTNARMQQLVTTIGLLPAETPLRSLLNKEQNATYSEAMTKLGLPVGAFDRFEPWFAGINLTMLPLMQQGYSPESGVEEVLLSHFKGKGRGALETIEFQLGIFDQLPQESQVAFLTETAANIDGIKPMLDQMVLEWLEGDADALAALMNSDLSDEVLAERLLYSRNRNWADWINERLDAPGTVFIAVGAGHLAGEHSVQADLGDIGLEVERVQ
jgi:uncharacterized protein YbaP (TraB family)